MKNRKIAFFTGCFTNYYYPEAGRALVAVFKKNGLDVVVPDQVCCGLPMRAKKNERGTRKNCDYNVSKFSRLLKEGCPIITTCPSCSLFLKRYYPELGNQAAKDMAANTYHFSEYLLKLHRLGELKTEFKTLPLNLFYKTPCHLRNAGIGHVTVELLKIIPGISMAGISNVCCGMGGAYGFEKRNRKMALEIGSKMFEDIKANPADRIVTDCGGCKLQIEYGTGTQVIHPVMLLHEAYGY